ncbi:LADA_0H06414g1_1 [Lachancea dasiensis]|uniref:DNA repair and recombination protein RDH54 n=1 Tax=Lachancea dasiensis TaxID=1072105 RepID=A0A1G4K1K9_9SACH|nr:LADA_0H06414g1_1 [Lachancea dasiensis]
MKLPQYVNKPFKSPLIASRTQLETKSGVLRQDPKDQDPRQKIHKRHNQEAEPSPHSTKKASNTSNCYSITYRKRTSKKNKTWDGDGYAIELSSGSFRFYKETGQCMGSASLSNCEDKFEKIFSCAGHEYQLDHQIKDENVIQELTTIVGNSVASGSRQRSLSPLPSVSPIPVVPVQKFKPIKKNPLQSRRTDLLSGSKTVTSRPLFEASHIENALVMNRIKGSDLDVVVDPILSKHLRPHQRIGIKFMYDCVMGLSKPQGYEEDGKTVTILEKTDEINGCLLADDMGLGKTLMTITLIWTLLKQNPLPPLGTTSQSGIPLQGVCSKVLVVCPVTLIGNWKREFGKWLNLNRIGVLTLSSKSTPEKDKLETRNFLKVQRSYQVLILGYEKVLSVSDVLFECRASIGLLVCDEGHRLKNNQSKTLNALKSIDIPKKILLTGTPIQNDLAEFFTILDFLNDGILGTFAQFKRDFINPISRSREVNNRYNELIQELGKERTNELIETTKRFTLRRTSDTIAKFLPPKTDIILFCKPTSNQLEAFESVLTKCHLDFSTMAYSSCLSLITLFKKICNSPSLISQDTFYLERIKPTINLTHHLSPDSGKLKVLSMLLSNIAKLNPREKIVIVSNYTQTLDIIQNLLRSNNFTNTRLDGSTPAKERDKIVNAFNKTPSIFVFLLSAKSGGVGLNLIGASRLILFDNDWNPAIDHQAMSRIHRDGQTKPCFIYRLLTTGCIDEKIFQRQLMKNSLSAKFMGGPGKESSDKADDDLFGNEDLKDLFSVLDSTSSNTHDLICTCVGDGSLEMKSAASNNEFQKPRVQPPTLNGWTSAMELRQATELANKENDIQKAALVKQCLNGYKHLKPSERCDLSEELAIDLTSTITFAFLKE